jgi:hypothetical protein
MNHAAHPSALSRCEQSVSTVVLVQAGPRDLSIATNAWIPVSAGIMPLIAPILDDRSFEDLFAELRNRIPVYNPAWTDHLDSDPGITLLQLFAYLGEGLQFRFNQIPEATQIAFLKLLDLPMEPARPAQALVRFESKVANGVVPLRGDQVKAGKTLFTLTPGRDRLAARLRHGRAPQPAQRRRPRRHDAKVRAFIDGLDSEQRVAVQAASTRSGWRRAISISRPTMC